MNPDLENDPSTGRLRGLAERLVQLLTTRLELLCFELSETRRVVTQAVVLVAAAAAFAAFAVVTLTFAFILALSPEWRPWGALLIGLAYGGGAAWALFRARRLVRDRLPPFPATLAELKRDREWLQALK